MSTPAAGGPKRRRRLFAWLEQLRLTMLDWNLRRKGFPALQRYQLDEAQTSARQAVHDVSDAIIELQTTAEEAEIVLDDAKEEGP